MEHHKFCECFEIVVADTSLPIQQKDPLHILEPWKKVCQIDDDELVEVTPLSIRLRKKSLKEHERKNICNVAETPFLLPAPGLPILVDFPTVKIQKN